jgi:very-short-patch-repair endonuclease
MFYLKNKGNQDNPFWKVYLAGRVSETKWGAVDGCCLDRVLFFASDGQNHSEHGWGSAVFTFGEEHLRNDVRRYALEPIDDCDFLLAYLDDDYSHGAIAEIAYASAKGKPVFVFIPTKEEDEPLSANFMGRWDTYWFVSHFPGVTVLNAPEDIITSTMQVVCSTESHMELALVSEIISQKVFLRLLKGQNRLGIYRSDIAFASPFKVAIEIDGHEGHKEKRHRIHDAKKDRFFSREGWLTVRFAGTEIFHEKARCCRDLMKILSKRLEDKGLSSCELPFGGSHVTIKAINWDKVPE